MANKKCMIFETLGKVSDLQVQESLSKKDGMRLSGVFGVCGVKNNNNRVYDKANYAQMVEGLQKIIATEGCPGELEHPNTMNINLENVSHKIESIEMNEDGTITGTILLLNTPKGKIAQAIVEGGLPLYISSRGAGTITNEGRVNLTTLKTYDLVGTPGFSQAKLNLKENQTVESLNESLEDGNMMWAIVDEDNVEEGLLDGGSGDNKDDKDEKKPDNTLDIKAKGPKEPKAKKEDDEEEEEKDSESKDNDSEKSEEKDNNKKDKTSMKDLKDAIDKLADKVSTLEAQLHVAQESLNPTNYEAIEKWIKEEFAPEFRKNIKSVVESDMKTWSVKEFAPKIQTWITEEYGPEIQRWITEEYSQSIEKWITEEYDAEVHRWIAEDFAPIVEKWITEEYSPEVEKWITEEYSPAVQNWITEEYSATLQQWISEEYSPVIQNWITEEYSPTIEGWLNEEFSTNLENKINENVSDYLHENNVSRLDEIDSLLESIADTTNEGVANAIKETRSNDRYAGVFCVEHMPDQYRPSWNMISETKQDEIVRSSRMYDFTKEGVLESFWSNVKFEDEPKQVVEESNDITSDYHNAIFAQMMRLRR